jgi:hypothetical protein
LTDAGLSRDIANSQARVSSTENVERESHGVMTLQRTKQMRHERFFQQVKPLCRRFGYAQPLAKFYDRSPPKCLQVNMYICQFACWRSKNLKEAGKLLAAVNAQTPSITAFVTKKDQFILERHFDEAIRLIHNRFTDYRDLPDIEKLFDLFFLLLAQQYAGDVVGARATAQQLLSPLETLCQNDADNPTFTQVLSVTRAVLGQRDAAIKGAERAIALLPSGKDAVTGPKGEEILAFVEVWDSS